MKSWVEISGSALTDNFRAAQTAAGEEFEMLAVIKADAYGHGARMCAPVLREAGARWLGVADVEEGAAVREALGAPLGAPLQESSTRILVMCGMEPHDAGAVVAHGLTPVVWTAEHLTALEEAARAAGRRVGMHVEVDTGMARQGAAVGAELQRVLARLAESRWLFCEGVMTHLCCAEVAGAATTTASQRLFAEALEAVAAAELRPEFVHVGNSSAVEEGSTMQWVRQQATALGARAMVRPGIALYGYSLPLAGASAVEGTLRANLQPVLTWKTRVLGVREIAAGATVGYGATFVAEGAMRLALLPVGYSDGFRRAASSGVGNGWAMLNGGRAAVVGRVSMNLTVIDVTDIEGVQEGAEVVLLGKGVSADDHARWAATISYEVLCGIRAPRVLR